MFSLEKQRLVVVQLLSHVQLFVSPWTAECQAPQSFTISRKWSEVKITQSCPILCDPMDCSLLGSSVHGILQARILEWVTIPFSMGSSRPRDWTCVFCIAGSFLTIWASREAPGQHSDAPTRPNWPVCFFFSVFTWGDAWTVHWTL